MPKTEGEPQRVNLFMHETRTGNDREIWPVRSVLNNGNCKRCLCTMDLDVNR